VLERRADGEVDDESLQRLCRQIAGLGVAECGEGPGESLADQFDRLRRGVVLG
jgi:hypothetical protein